MSLGVDALEPRRMLATFSVSNLADSGSGSLRDAIEAANELPGADVIEFDPDLARGTITLGGRQLTISDDITINGLDGSLLTVSGDHRSPVLRVASGVTTTIRGLRITRGSAETPEDGPGGGISNFGALTLIDSLVEKSVVRGSGGGGIANAGTLTLVNSRVVSNTATGVGGAGAGGIQSGPGSTLALIDSSIFWNASEAGGAGGISIEGELTLTRSRIEGNRTTGSGGGILLKGGTATLVDSVIGANSAAVGGGGIDNALGTLTLLNSTVSGNGASNELAPNTTSGGGIRNSGPLTVVNSTISSNFASRGGGVESTSASVTFHNATVAENSNGGVYSEAGDTGSILAISSIFAYNHRDGRPLDLSGFSLAPGSTHNIISDAESAAGLINGIDNNLVGVDPLLGTLDDHGGLTRTHALIPGSPAIGSGTNPLSLATDQRGGSFSRVTDATIDIGAYQHLPIAATIVVDTLLDENDGDHSLGDLSLREAVLLANDLEGPAEIVFSPDLRGGVILLSGTDLTISNDVKITGPGADLLTISGGNASRVFFIQSWVIAAISGLTISDGNGTGSADYGSGGGINNFGTLMLRDSVVARNSAMDDGGGISSCGTVILVHSAVTDNDAPGYGGGISQSEARLTVKHSVISLNTSLNGGGISVICEAFAVVTLIDSTVADNHAGNDGGGILVNGPSLTLTNSVVRDNTAGGSGGGFESSAAVMLRSSAVHGNSANRSGGGIAMTGGVLSSLQSTISLNHAAEGGGGIWAGPYAGVTVINSTISLNVAANGGGMYVSSATVSASNSTIVRNSEIKLGGGIYTHRMAGVAPLMIATSSIISDNTQDGRPDDVFGKLASGSSNNLIGNARSAGGLINSEDGNIVGVDPLLGPLADNGGPTQTHALLSDSPAIDRGINPQGLPTDQRGATRAFGNGADIGAFEWGSMSSPRGGSDGDGTHRVVSVDMFGHVLVFEQGWTFEDLQAKTGAPIARGDAAIWTDPKDELTYVAAASEDGLLLFARSGTGVWTYRNLTLETGASASPVRDLTHFVSIRRKVVVIAGITADDGVVAFQQTLADASGGGPAFAFVDISADLESQGQSTPRLSGLTSYVPRWDTWHLAGVDAAGRIHSIWINTNNSSFTKWRTNDLSAITGAPPLSGQLAVTLTSWGGINLTGLDTSGNLLTTWWVPRFGGRWAVSNLTSQQGGPPLVGGNLTAYTTPWGGINYVGLDESGVARVYWWVPSFGGRWAASRLLPESTRDAMIPTGTLQSSVSSSGTLNVYGLSADGHILRMSWNPRVSSPWAVEDLTEVSVAR